MITIKKRCMGKKPEITYKKWDYHPAFLHFKDYKNTFVNGKPLKWWNILPKNATIEVINTPKEIFTTLSLIFTALLVAHPVATVLGTLAVVGLAVTAVGSLTQSRPATAAGASQKEYSSTSHPELTGASNDISNSIIPVLFGKTQQTPSYGQLSYRLVGDGSSTNKLNLYFISNYNNVVYSDYKLAETSKNDFSIDFFDVDAYYGDSTFRGFDNCKAIEVNEQLSYDSSGEVQQSNTWNYNQTTSSTSVKIDFIVEFTNVVIASWANKTFRLNVDVLNGATPSILTDDFTVASGDLTLVSGTTYRYTGTKTFTATITSLISTEFYPAIYTRGNSTETSNELNVIYVSEDITTDDWTNSKTFNQSINYYVGTTSEVVQTSPPDTTEIDIFISFPQGLYRQNNDGSRSNRTAKIQIDYKPDGGSWTPISSATSLYVRGLDGTKNSLSTSTTTVSGNVVTVNSTPDLSDAADLFFRPIGFVLPSGKYSVRVRSADYADKTNFDIGVPYVADIQFRMTGSPVNTDILTKVNQIRVVATAYKGLSGTLKKFNYIGEAVIPIWDGTNWNTTDKSINPAAIIRHLLTDKLVNPRAISADLIDNDTLVEFYNWCASEGYTASGIISEEIKISEVISNILQNCQASMIPLFRGKHTFVIDKSNKTVKGLFAQHNTWDFKSYPTIGRQTEAIRASFLDNDDYTTDELTVYWYDNAVHIEPKAGKTDDDYEIVKKEYKYVNDRASVFKIATYDLTNTQTKRRNFEFNCNLEALNLALLDRIMVSDTTNMQNESSGNIKSILMSGTDVLGFQLYSEIDIASNSKIVVRSLDYENQQPIVNTYNVTNTGNTDIVYIDDGMGNPITDEGYLRGQCEIDGVKDKIFYDGDLFVIGQDTVYDCLITDIKYGDDSTATITARKY